METTIFTNATAQAMPFGTPIYAVGVGDNSDLAVANDQLKAVVTGLVADLSVGASGAMVTEGPLTAADPNQWDIVTGRTGGLIPGAAYFLDPDYPGRLTPVAPVTSGQFVARVGVAVSDVTLDIQLEKTVKLSTVVPPSGQSSLIGPTGPTGSPCSVDDIQTVLARGNDGNGQSITGFDNISLLLGGTISAGSDGRVNADGSISVNAQQDAISTAIGEDATAQSGSVAIGMSAHANNGAIAVGKSAIASQTSLAIGGLAAATENATAFGNGAFANNGSDALGSASRADSGSVALGGVSDPWFWLGTGVASDGSNCVNPPFGIGGLTTYGASGSPSQSGSSGASGVSASGAYWVNIGVGQSDVYGYYTANNLASGPHAGTGGVLWNWAIGASGSGASATSESVACGNSAEASNSSVAFGFGARGASGSSAIGYMASAQFNGIAIGNTTTAGGSSIAVGSSRENPNTRMWPPGVATRLDPTVRAVGYNTLAMGCEAAVTGNCSTLIGTNPVDNGVTIVGNYSTAIGAAYMEGDYSVSIGMWNQVIGSHSTAAGGHIMVTGNFSICVGPMSIWGSSMTLGDYQIALACMAPMAGSFDMPDSGHGVSINGWSGDKSVCFVLTFIDFGYGRANGGTQKAVVMGADILYGGSQGDRTSNTVSLKGTCSEDRSVAIMGHATSQFYPANYSYWYEKDPDIWQWAWTDGGPSIYSTAIFGVTGVNPDGSCSPHGAWGSTAIGCKVGEIHSTCLMSPSVDNARPMVGYNTHKSLFVSGAIGIVQDDTDSSFNHVQLTTSVGLPMPSATGSTGAPATMASGDLWIDRAAGGHDNILKVW